MDSPISLFPGVPLIESPIFGTVLDRMGLSDREHEIAVELNSNGYAVFDFPDSGLDARIDRIRRRFAPEFGLDESDPGPKLSPAGRIQDAWQRDEDVRAIASNPTVVSLLSKLWGRRAFPFQTLNFPVGTQQHVHTDSVHFSSVPERFMCGVWLAMEDVDAGAGPLCYYYPGSHKWPILSNLMIGRRGWESQLESAQTPYHDAWEALIAEHGVHQETFLARKGQALIWCANLLHGGSPRTDPTRTRWSQVTHYYFDDCVYYTPAFSDEPIGRLALREIVNVADGSSKPNLYLDEEIRPPPPPEEQPKRTAWKRIKRRAARLANRSRRQEDVA